MELTYLRNVVEQKNLGSGAFGEINRYSLEGH